MTGKLNETNINAQSLFELRSENFVKVVNMKQVLLALFVLVISTTVYAACVNRDKDESSDIYEDIKCGLSSAGDKLKDGASTAGTSIKEGSSKAWDFISKAAAKTGSALRDGLSVAVEKSVSGYEKVRDVISGRKTTENADGEEITEIRNLDVPEKLEDVTYLPR